MELEDNVYDYKKSYGYPVKVTGPTTLPPLVSPHLLEKLNKLSSSGMEVLTPLQNHVIPIIEAKRDLMAHMRDDPAAYLVPIVMEMEKKQTTRSGSPKCVIVSPFPEDINQIKRVADTLSDRDGPRTVVDPGALKQGGGCEILIVKPTTFIKLLKTESVLFNQVEVLVLDKADVFIEIFTLITQSPNFEGVLADNLPGKERRQTLVFSH